MSFAMLLLATTTPAAAAPAKPTAPRAAAYDVIEGTWTIDLRLQLTDAAYSQPMELHIGADKVVTGAFYNSVILAGHAGTAQGRSCVAFRTTDGSGLYHTSACLVDGKMVGQTWSEGRNFVLPWTATRK